MAEATEAVNKFLAGNFVKFIPIKGEDAMRHGLKLKRLESHHRMTSIPVVTYDYPVQRVTTQNKKTYRTIYRRRQRKLKQEQDAHNKDIRG